MSDHYFRVIPTDPEWQPTTEAAARTARYLTGLFAEPGDYVETVEPVFHDDITLIDCGEDMEDVFCPRCEAAIGLEWFWDLLRSRNGGRFAGAPTIDDLNVTVPCCAATLQLPELRFEAPVGFARFEVSAMNCNRSVWGFSDEELATAGGVLGHPVAYVHAHY